MKISSIFTTLDGECTLGGPLQFSVFVRTGGCHIRCWKSSGYCDAPHTLSLKYPYREMTVREVAQDVASRGPRRCTITGGEPLLQRDEVLELSRRLRLLNCRFLVSLETSGTKPMSIHEINSFDCVIMDLKPPTTEMAAHNSLETVPHLRGTDYLKVVVSDLSDLVWLEKTLEPIAHECQIAVGPRHGWLSPSKIYDWMLEHKKFDWRLNLQLHKMIWGEAKLPDLSDRRPEDLTEDEVVKITKGDM